MGPLLNSDVHITEEMECLAIQHLSTVHHQGNFVPSLEVQDP